MQEEVLGVDIGRVILSKGAKIPDGFRVLSRLKNERFGSNIFLISHAKPLTEINILWWLKHHRFYERTGIPQSHVYFCRKRIDKVLICRQLGITHFIDDRLENLGYVYTGTDIRNLFLFQPRKREVRKYRQFEDVVCTVHSWEEIERILLLS